jgi:hypothetical protein
MTTDFSIRYNNNSCGVFFRSYPCYDNTTCAPVEKYLKKGVYLFELWGARSGNDYFGTGHARGGYVSGILKLTEAKRLIINIGGVGSDGDPYSNKKGGNNGGGDGGFGGASGGGATDVRLDYSLQSRIIVAAGAGGGERISDGHGGGVSGLTGSSTNCGPSHSLHSGSGPGTQTSGGKSGYSTIHGYAEAGSFGKGGSGIRSENITEEGGGGGGGGYFGGGAVPYVCSGSGGSSYVSGHPDCMSVIGPDSNVTNSSTVHYSGLRFLDPEIISGNSRMPLPSFDRIIGLGNDGPGAIKITLLDSCTNSRYKFRKHFMSVFL